MKESGSEAGAARPSARRVRLLVGVPARGQPPGDARRAFRARLRRDDGRGARLASGLRRGGYFSPSQELAQAAGQGRRLLQDLLLHPLARRAAACARRVGVLEGQDGRREVAGVLGPHRAPRRPWPRGCPAASARWRAAHRSRPAASWPGARRSRAAWSARPRSRQVGGAARAGHDDPEAARSASRAKRVACSGLRWAESTRMS